MFDTLQFHSRTPGEPPKKGALPWGRSFCLKLTSIQKSKIAIDTIPVLTERLVKILHFEKMAAYQKKNRFLWKVLHLRAASKVENIINHFIPFNLNLIFVVFLWLTWSHHITSWTWYFYFNGFGSRTNCYVSLL